MTILTQGQNQVILKFSLKYMEGMGKSAKAVNLIFQKLPKAIEAPTIVKKVKISF